MLRILLWTASFPPDIGGVARISLGIARGLSKRGHAVAVLAPSEEAGVSLSQLPDGGPLLRLPFAHALARRDPSALGPLRQQVADLKRSFAPDVIHFHSLQPGFVFHRQTREAHAAKTLYTLHANTFLRLKDGLIRELLREADAVTTVSQSLLLEIGQRAPELSAKTCFVPNGSEAPALEPSPLPVDPPRLLLLGRLAHEKGFDLGLAAFAQVSRRFPEACASVVGDGPERGALEAQAAALGIQDRVSFLGPLPGEEIPAQIDAATLLVAPSRSEAFGLAALEAVLQARPVVATRVGGLPETVGPGGLLVPPGDVDALAEGIERVLSDPGAAVAMGRAGRRYALRAHDWKACLDRYEALYRELIEGGRSEARG